MNKNTKNANARNIFAIMLAFSLLTIFITACDPLKTNGDRPSGNNTDSKSYTGKYTIGELRDTDGNDFPGTITDLSVSDTVAKLTFMAEDTKGNEVRQEVTLAVKNGIAEKVVYPLGVLINFTDDVAVYYRMQVKHDRKGSKKENYTLSLALNKDKTALSDSTTYPAVEYSSTRMLEKNKITFLLPKRDEEDNALGVPTLDATGHPVLEIYTGTIAKK